jgi:hypothetical protein
MRSYKVAKLKNGDLKWSLWDRVEIEGVGMTLQQLIDHLEGAYGLTTSMCSYVLPWPFVALSRCLSILFVNTFAMLTCFPVAMNLFSVPFRVCLLIFVLAFLRFCAQVWRRHHLLVLWQQEGDGHSPRHAARRRLRARQQIRAAQGACIFIFLFHFIRRRIRGVSAIFQRVYFAISLFYKSVQSKLSSFFGRIVSAVYLNRIRALNVASLFACDAGHALADPRRVHGRRE